MKKILTVTLFFLVISVQAQFLDTKIEFKNGTVKKGLMKKIKNAFIEKISFKESQNAKIIEFENYSIKQITLYNKKNPDIIYIYEYMLVDTYLKKNGGIKFKEKRIWLLMRYKLDNLKLYAYKPGQSFLYQTVSGAIQTLYYAKRNNEKKATFIAVNTAGNYYLKRKGSDYFSDYPELSLKLKKKKLKTKHIMKIVEV